MKSFIQINSGPKNMGRKFPWCKTQLMLTQIVFDSWPCGVDGKDEMTAKFSAFNSGSKFAWLSCHFVFLSHERFVFYHEIEHPLFPCWTNPSFRSDEINLVKPKLVGIEPTLSIHSTKFLSMQFFFNSVFCDTTYDFEDLFRALMRSWYVRIYASNYTFQSV